MNKAWITLIIFLCVLCSLCQAADNDAQTRNIKLSGEYYIGESSGKYTSANRDSVESNLKLQAQQDLALNIQSFICASITQNDVSSATSTDESLCKQMLISGSMIGGNIKYLVETEKKKLKVLAYLAKADLTKSEQDYIKRIQDTVLLAENQERSSGMCEALPLYYTAWLQSSFISTTIPYTTITNETKQDIRAFLTYKLDTCLKSIKLSTQVGTPVEQPLFQIPVHITLSGEGACDDVQISVPAWSYEQISFQNKELTLFCESMPSKSSVRLAVKLNISPDLVKNEPVLWNIAQNRIYSLDTFLDIDYSPIIDTEIEFSQTDSLFAFDPIIINLSISTYHWDFGDGSQSAELNPQHVYSKSGKYEVCLLLNGSIKDMKTVEVKAADTVEQSTQPVVIPKEDIVTSTPKTSVDNSDVIPQIIHELMRCRDYPSTIEKLSTYKKTKKLLWGKTQDFLYPEKCWLLVFNPDNNKLEAVLSPGKAKRVEFISKTEISDYSKVYSSKGVICVQLN